MDGTQTLTLNNFGDGEDLRDGDFGNDQSRFLALKNYRTTDAKRLVRRSPVREVAGAFGDQVLGLQLRDGVLYGIAPAGVVSDIDVPTGVELLRFDVPTGASEHRLVDVQSMGDRLLYLIAHGYPSGSWRYFLHVKDGLPDLPSFVTDPGFPWMHYIADSFDELPVLTLAISASKVVIPTPDGLVAYSGVENPRLWNKFLVEQILINGYQLHHYHDATVDENVLIPIPANALDFADGLSQTWWQNIKSVFTNWRVQECVVAGDLDNRLAVNEDQWQDSAGAVGNEYTYVLGYPAAAGEAALTSSPNTAEVASYTNWAAFSIRMKPGRWYRICWTPSNIVNASHKSYVVSSVFENATNGPVVGVAKNIYQFLVADAAQTDFELNENFILPTVAAQFVVKQNGTAIANPADYTIEVVNTNKCKLKLVVAATIGDAFEIEELPAVFSGGVTYVTVPPARISIDGQLFKFDGGTVILPDGSGAGSVNAYVGIDTRALKNGSNGLTSWYSGSPYVNPWTFLMLANVTADFPTGPTIVVSFTIGFVPTARQQSAYEAALDFAGRTPTESDTGILPTSSHDNTGGIPTMLVGLDDRLLVCYGGSMQLWQFDRNGENNRLLDKAPMGTGSQETPHAVIIDEMAILPLLNGYWASAVGGQLSDTMKNETIGKKIQRLGFPQVHTAGWWPYFNEYVAWEVVGGEGRFRVLDHHPKEKVAAWSRFYVDGIESVDFKSFIPVGPRLYFRSGSKLYYFDGEADGSTGAPFRDFGDVPGLAYESIAEFRMNDLKSPGTQKEFHALQVIQVGRARFDFRTWADNMDLIAPGPDLLGTTANKPMVGLGMMCEHIGVIVTSKQESGHELQQIGLVHSIWGG